MKMGPMEPAAIDEVLRTGTLAHLAYQAGGQPLVVPVQYAYDGEAVYVHSLEGGKVRTLRENPRVCLQVEEIETPISWRSVMVTGRYEELEGEPARSALRLLVDHLLPPGTIPEGVDPFAPPGMESMAVLFRVPVESRAGRFVGP